MTRKGKCTVCGVRGIGTGGGDDADYAAGVQMCNPCATESGWENTHSDYGHDRIRKAHEAGEVLDEHDVAEVKTMQGCWVCVPELNLALAPARAGSTGPKKQGERRPQLNHRGHSHPQTPAARRACKALFWAAVKVVDPTPEQYETHLAEAMQGWNAHLDATGKPVEPAKPQTKFTVVPRGPKGGVINQLKASKRPLHPDTPGSYEIVVE